MGGYCWPPACACILFSSRFTSSPPTLATSATTTMVAPPASSRPVAPDPARPSPLAVQGRPTTQRSRRHHPDLPKGPISMLHREPLDLQRPPEHSRTTATTACSAMQGLRLGILLRRSSSWILEPSHTASLPHRTCSRRFVVPRVQPSPAVLPPFPDLHQNRTRFLQRRLAVEDWVETTSFQRESLRALA